MKIFFLPNLWSLILWPFFVPLSRQRVWAYNFSGINTQEEKQALKGFRKEKRKKGREKGKEAGRGQRRKSAKQSMLLGYNF